MSGINVWKTSFIGLNKPPKVISAVATTFSTDAYWPYPNSSSDPYYAFGANPKPYRWKVTFSVPLPMQHGSNLTRIPFQYTGNDVEVGDFVAGAQDAKVLQVVSIVSKNDFEVVAIVEDRLRYNTFLSSTGDGLFGVVGDVVFFQINELGVPMIDPAPSTISVTFGASVMARFNYMNPLTNYILEKKDNSFKQGDAICIEDGQFVKSDVDNVSKFIGTVVSAGPGPNQFILRPGNGIVDFIPALPGNVGDYIYPTTDGLGGLTTSDESRRPILMKIAAAEPTYSIGTSPNRTGNSGDIIQLNGVEITLNNSSSATYDLNFAINAINALSSQHKLTASKVNAATTITSNIGGLGSAYGFVALKIPQSGPKPTAIINGVTVTFKTNIYSWINFAELTYCAAGDMALDINEANIPNISAYVNNSGNLVIKNEIGGSITIQNGVNDADNKPFAGPNSTSSLALSVAANTANEVLKISRDDGGPMTIIDKQGSFLTDCGVISGQNGHYALGLFIEQGLRNGNTSVVANITARDALRPLVGDQAYVINSADGNGNYANQWSIWLWNGSAWTIIGRESSATVDSKTLSYSISNTTPQTFTIGQLTTGTRIVSILIDVTTAFNGTPIMSLGYEIASTPKIVSSDGLATNFLFDLKTAGKYIIDGTTKFGIGGTTGANVNGDILITGNLAMAGVTQGAAKIIITYV